MKLIREEKSKIHNFDELDEYCKKLVPQLSKRSVILISGDLGAGKTKTVERLLSQVGISQVSSPTFALHHHYQSSSHLVDHFDLYRIESEADLESTGFWDVFSQENGWVIVEWPERLPANSLPSHWHRVEIKITLSENSNSIRLYTSKYYAA